MKKLPLVFIVLFFYLCSNEGLGKVTKAIILQKSKHNSIENAQYEKAQSVFLLSPNTSFIIEEGVIFTVSSDVILWSNVQGEGVLQIKGKRPLVLDAHHFKINRLFIDNEMGLELKSPLTIAKELYIIEGSFYLNNFNIILDRYSIRVRASEKGQLVFNGIGQVVVRNHEPLVSQSLLPFTPKAPCYTDLISLNPSNITNSKNYSFNGSVYKPFQLISPKPPP